jgi:hypothetical protein
LTAASVLAVLPTMAGVTAAIAFAVGVMIYGF